MNHNMVILLAVLGLGISPVFGLRAAAQNAPIDWVAQDLVPALMYPLTMARNAPILIPPRCFTTSCYPSRASS